MTTATAFGITEEDVEQVLREHTHRVNNSAGKSFETLACELIDEIDHERVAQAALDSGTEMDQQITGALGEIKTILVKIGALKF